MMALNFSGSPPLSGCSFNAFFRYALIDAEQCKSWEEDQGSQGQYDSQGNHIQNASGGEDVYSLFELRLGSSGWHLEEVVELCLLNHDEYGVCSGVVRRFVGTTGRLESFANAINRDVQIWRDNEKYFVMPATDGPPCC